MAAGNSISNRHGHTSGDRKSKTYTCWRSMMQRCYRAGDRNFKYYGARGIVVCERWHDFRNFLTDMGTVPDGLTIDRINENGNYEFGNCRWATSKTQVRNRRNTVFVTFKGESRPLGEWSEITGINYRCLARRYYKGYDAERMLTMPKMTLSESAKLGGDTRWGNR